MKPYTHKFIETADLRTLAERLSPDQELLTVIEVASWQQALPNLTRQVLGRLNLLTTGSRKKLWCKMQLQATTRECVALMDMLTGFAAEARLVPLMEQLSGCLDDIYGSCVCLSGVFRMEVGAMPLKQLKNGKEHLQRHMDSLREALSAPGIDVRLKHIVLQSLRTFLEADREHRERLDYLLYFAASILKFLQATHTGDINMQLITHLCQLNYNAEPFLIYYRELICAELNMMSKPEDQLELLYRYKQRFGKIPHRSSASALHTDQPGVCQAMNDVLKLEFHRIKNRQKFQLAAQYVSPSGPFKADSDTGFQIDTKMSVSCLAYLVRLLVRTELVETAIKSQLLSFVAVSVRTPGTAGRSISVESLTTKYKQVTQHTATTVRAALKKMLRQLDDDFNF